MKCFIGTMDFQIQEPTIVTLGKFDGRPHQGPERIARVDAGRACTQDEYDEKRYQFMGAGAFYAVAAEPGGFG